MKLRLVLIIIILFLCASAFWGWFGFLESGALNILEPVLSFTQGISSFLSSITSTFIGVPYNAEEIRSLKEKNIQLQAQVALLETAEKENQILREALDWRDAGNDLLYARVLEKSLNGIDDYLIIHGGIEDGVAHGMAVLAPGGILIGHIAETSGGISKVRMLSDSREKTEVYLPNSNITSVAEGRGLGVLVVQIPSSIVVKEKDPVYVTGANDYLVGFVEKIERSDAGPFQIIKTSSPLSLKDIRIVFIVR